MSESIHCRFRDARPIIRVFSEDMDPARRQLDLRDLMVSNKDTEPAARCMTEEDAATDKAKKVRQRKGDKEDAATVKDKKGTGKKGTGKKGMGRGKVKQDKEEDAATVTDKKAATGKGTGKKAKGRGKVKQDKEEDAATVSNSSKRKKPPATPPAAPPAALPGPPTAAPPATPTAAPAAAPPATLPGSPPAALPGSPSGLPHASSAHQPSPASSAKAPKRKSLWGRVLNSGGPQSAPDDPGAPGGSRDASSSISSSVRKLCKQMSESETLDQPPPVPVLERATTLALPSGASLLADSASFFAAKMADKCWQDMQQKVDDGFPDVIGLGSVCSGSDVWSMASEKIMEAISGRTGTSSDRGWCLCARKISRSRSSWAPLTRSRMTRTRAFMMMCTHCPERQRRVCGMAASAR